MDPLSYIVMCANKAAIEDADRDIQGWVDAMKCEGIATEYTLVQEVGSDVRQHELKITYLTFNITINARSYHRVCSFEKTVVRYEGMFYYGRTKGRGITVLDENNIELGPENKIYDVIRVLHKRVAQEF